MSRCGLCPLPTASIELAEECVPGEFLCLFGLRFVLWWPMRLLDRYLLRELGMPLLYCLAGFLIFWISFDLFSDLDDFQKAQMSAREIAQYYVVRTPELLVTVLPVALLLGLLYALTHH